MNTGTIALASAAMILVPVLAEAGNGAHPRTPVDWSQAPCMTIIDRSQSPIYPLAYDIPYEDTDVSPDEVDGSRTHQFFTFCRDRHLEDLLPNWITEADANAAAANGLGDIGIVDLELHVLENAPNWADCWARINSDLERRPITFAAAADPVMWDTTMLPAGTWVVEAYTFEPWFNMWTPHPGVFKIVDDPDPAASPPAAALTFVEQTIEYGNEASITGCVDAMAGATMTLSWSNGNINGDPNWEVFSADIPVDGGAFDLPFAPPLEAVSNSVMIKLDVVDSMGREWTAFSREYIAVVEGVGDEGCEDDGGFVGDPCDESGSDTGLETGGAGSEDGSGDSGGGSTGPGLDDGSGGSGCSCTTHDSPGTGLVFSCIAGLAFAGRVRRRAVASR